MENFANVRNKQVMQWLPVHKFVLTKPGKVQVTFATNTP